jgi:predicted glycoside hydrolase/deacetylase ChbG (UPF0249 family)
MLIVNADDWGRNAVATDNTLDCVQAGSVTSVSAMVFMRDSARAAAIALEERMDVGLHINLSEKFSGTAPDAVSRSHGRICRFLRASKFALLLYHPLLRADFTNVISSQLHEFRRLYRYEPSHFDGHQHMHLCSNVLIDRLIPTGTKVRRSFTFDRGEKGAFNRAYRSVVDALLQKRHRTTDAFYALSAHLPLETLTPVLARASKEAVELMAHPEVPAEREALLSSQWNSLVKDVPLRTYSDL